VLSPEGGSSQILQLGFRACLFSGQPDIYGEGPALRVWDYDPTRVTPAELLEAHEVLVVQGRSGILSLSARKPRCCSLLVSGRTLCS
jgi:hypothetical protein